MSRIRGLFRISPFEGEVGDDPLYDEAITQEDHLEQIETDKSYLGESSGKERKLTREAERRVASAAEESFRRLHVIKLGRCPECNGHLRRHLFASICETCGWHTYDAPRSGPVRVHLRDGATIQGDRCYRVKSGSVLVLRNDVVTAHISRNALGWIEYLWTETEIDDRHRQVVDNLEVLCGWCNSEADPEADGFHLVQIAFGRTQERYCFCSDECYEAFRKMYPARVDRNCYERQCSSCNLCVKRYDDETEGIRMLAKDYLQVRRAASRGTTEENQV